jgi:hypothetical protein
MVDVAAASIMTAQCDANDSAGVYRHTTQSGIAPEESSHALPVVALSDLKPFDALPKLKRHIVIADTKLARRDRATHVVIIWFHLDQSDAS